MKDLSFLDSRIIPEFDGYLFLSDGKVLSQRPVIHGFKSTKSTEWVKYRGELYKLLKQSKRQGYPTVNLKNKPRSTHILMARAFLGEKPFKKALVRHLDDVRDNNDINNLAYGSYSDNHFDAVRNGRIVYKKRGKKIVSEPNRQTSPNRVIKRYRHRKARLYADLLLGAKRKTRKIQSPI